MNEIEMALLRHEQRKEKKMKPKKNSNFISESFTKILLSIIFLLLSVIYIKLSPENLEYFKKHIFESNLTFTKINNWYHNTFGSILPTVKEPNDSLVSKNITSGEKEEYLDGYKIKSSLHHPVVSLSGGLLVFMGEKEGYGNTFIIQGMDGVDIWYGGLENGDLKLYDYVDAGSIIGSSKNDFYYLVFKKDGEKVSYEEYQKQISS